MGDTFVIPVEIPENTHLAIFDLDFAATGPNFQPAILICCFWILNPTCKLGRRDTKRSRAIGDHRTNSWYLVCIHL